MSSMNKPATARGATTCARYSGLEKVTAAVSRNTAMAYPMYRPRPQSPGANNRVTHRLSEITPRPTSTTP
jgi:hypothetical protein